MMITSSVFETAISSVISSECVIEWLCSTAR